MMEKLSLQWAVDVKVVQHQVLKQGVESYIVAKVEGVNEVVDMTDHTQGENPYYTQPVQQPAQTGGGCGCSSGASQSSGGGCCSTDSGQSQGGGGGCGCN